MTIPEYAKSKGKSRQSIYQKLTVCNIDRISLLDETGNLTDEGLKQLDSIMQKPHKKRVEHKTVNNSSDEQQAVIRAKEAEIDLLQTRISDLTGQCEEWHNLFLQERQRTETMLATINQLTVDLSQAQALHATDKKKLSAGEDKSFLSRLFKKR